MFWQGRPFLRILPFFAAGILVAHQGFDRDKLFLPVIVFLGIFLLAAYIGTRIRSFKFGWIPGVLLLASLFFTGFVLTRQQIQKANRPLPEGKIKFWYGKLLTEPVQRSHSVKFILKITGTCSPDSTFPTAGKALAYLKTDTLPAGLHAGSQLVFSGKMLPVMPPANPGEFDYRQFLLDRGIKYRTYINQNAWLKLPVASGFSLPVLFGKWRNRLLQLLRSQGLTRSEYSIAAAILLGYDQLIEPGLHQDFTAAGAVHILCVSGMHVGIVYLILSLLFSFLLRFKHGKNLRNLLLLLGIWAYALLTGLSPSVSRAAAMLSLFIAADMLSRTYDRFNILAASAFLLLTINPLMLFDVGFQLSYAAVSGILLFYFPLYRSVWLGNKILQTLWAALAVSASAQLGAFAIAAHYFHQFPVYFLLTNLAVFTLSYIIIFSGIAFLALSWLPVVSTLLSKLLGSSVNLLIFIVRHVAALPHAAVYDLYFPWFQVILIFALLLLAYSLFIQKNLHSVLPGLAVVVLLLASYTVRHIRRIRQQKFIVYALRHNTAIDIIRGTKHLLLLDTAAYHHPEKMDYSLKENRIALGLLQTRHRFTEPYSDNNFYYRSGFGKAGNLRFYVPVSGKKYYPYLSQKVRVDYLICAPPWKTSLSQIVRAVNFRKVILNASLPRWAERKIIKEAIKLNIKYIDLKKSNAFVLNLQ